MTILRDHTLHYRMTRMAQFSLHKAGALIREFGALLVTLPSLHENQGDSAYRGKAKTKGVLFLKLAKGETCLGRLKMDPDISIPGQDNDFNVTPHAVTRYCASLYF